MEAVCCSTKLAPTHQNRTLCHESEWHNSLCFCTACQEQALKVKRSCCCLRKPDSKWSDWPPLFVCPGKQRGTCLQAVSGWLLPSASHDRQLHASAKKQTQNRPEFPNVAKYLLGYDTVQSGKCVQELQRYIPFPSSEYSVQVASGSDSFVNLLNAAETQKTGNRYIIQYILSGWAP